MNYAKNVERYARIIDLWPQSLLDPAPMLAAESRSTSRDRCTASLGQAERTFLRCVVSSPAVCPAAPRGPAGRFWIPACGVVPTAGGPGTTLQGWPCSSAISQLSFILMKRSNTPQNSNRQMVLSNRLLKTIFSISLPKSERTENSQKFII